MRGLLLAVAASLAAGGLAGHSEAAPNVVRKTPGCLIRIVSETQCINGYRVVCRFRITSTCQRIPLSCSRPPFPVPCFRHK